MKRWTRPIATFLIALFLGTGMAFAMDCSCPMTLYEGTAVEHQCCKKNVRSEHCPGKQGIASGESEESSKCECSIRAEQTTLEQPASLKIETPEFALVSFESKSTVLISSQKYSPATYWQLYPDRSKTYFFTQRFRL